MESTQKLRNCADTSWEQLYRMATERADAAVKRAQEVEARAEKRERKARNWWRFPLTGALFGFAAGWWVMEPMMATELGWARFFVLCFAGIGAAVAAMVEP